MDFSLDYSKEQEEFAREVRAWLDKNIPADLESVRDPIKMSREQFQKRRELGKKLGKQGWLHPAASKKYGGGGLDANHAFVIHEEVGKKGFGLPPYYDIGASLAAPAILACGTDEQKERFLKKIYTGEAVTWQLFTEPEAGTDEANQHTTALRHRREGEYYVVNGSKIFVGGFYAPPDFLLLLTRCDLTAPRHENLAMFVAPANLPGISIQTLGLFPSANFAQACSPGSASSPGDKHSVFLDEVRIHESNLIGGEGGGWRATMATLTAEHGDREGGEGGGGVVSKSLLIEKILDQCRKNPSISKRVMANAVVRDRLVELYLCTEIERLWSIRNAWISGSGKRAPYAGPQLSAYSKIFGNKAMMLIGDILGPYALTDDAEWGLDDGFFELGERGGVCTAPAGTPEALKIIISRLLGIGR